MSNQDNADTHNGFEFDIALSFAGEDRKTAEELAHLLIERNVSVFYDAHLRAELWGKDHQHLQSVYRDKARYCIILVSKAFKEKPWTRYELRQAQARELFESREYILALRLDDTDLPGLNPTSFYEDLRNTDLNQICDLVIKKLEGNYFESNQAIRQLTVELPEVEVEKSFVKKSFFANVEEIARKRIPRLILIWVQLIFFGFVFGPIGSQTIGGVFVFSLLLIFPLSIVISRLVDRDILLSILVGGLVNGILVGAIGFSLNKDAITVGILYGVFFGASLTVYFSRADKDTALFTALINTCFLISATWILICGLDYRGCIETFRDYPENSVRLGLIAVIFGLLMVLIAKPFTYLFEFLIDKVVETISGSTD